MAPETRLFVLRCLLARLRGEPLPVPEHRPAEASAPAVALDAPEPGAPAAHAVESDAHVRRLQILRGLLARLGATAGAPPEA
jgi:hypothetical protein